MTTTKKLALAKAQQNQNGNKAVKYIIIGTILIISLAVFIGLSSFGLSDTTVITFK